MTPKITSIQLDANGQLWFAAIFRGKQHPRPTCFGSRIESNHADYQPTMSSAIRLQRVQIELVKRARNAQEERKP